MVGGSGTLPSHLVGQVLQMLQMCAHPYMSAAEWGLEADTWVAALGAALAALRGRAAFLALHAQLASAAGLDEIFERLHAIEVNEADEFALSLWRRVRPQLQRAALA